MKISFVNENSRKVTQEHEHDAEPVLIDGIMCLIDKKMVNLIKAMNEVGLKTLVSCEKTRDGFNRAYVMLKADGVSVNMENRKGLIWTREKDGYHNAITISWKIPTGMKSK